MRKFHFAIAAAAMLGLAACSGQDDTVENVEAYDNQAELDYLAENAATEAETGALGNQAQQLEAEDQAEDSVTDNVATEPSDVEDDVQGM